MMDKEFDRRISIFHMGYNKNEFYNCKFNEDTRKKLLEMCEKPKTLFKNIKDKMCLKQ